MRYRLRRKDGAYDVYECRGPRVVRIARGLSDAASLALVRG